MSRQPPAARPAACGQSARGAPCRTAHGLDERRGEDQRQVADRGDRGVVLRRVHRDRPGAAGARQRGHDVRVAVAAPPRRARSPTAGRRTGRRRTPRSRACRGRPSDGRRRTGARAASARATSAAFVLATSVMTASGAEGRATTARRGRRAARGTPSRGRRGRRGPRPRSRLGDVGCGAVEHAVGDGRRGTGARRAPRDERPARPTRATRGGRARPTPRSARSRGRRSARGRPQRGQSFQPALPRRGRSSGRRRGAMRAAVAHPPLRTPSGGPGSSGGFWRRIDLAPLVVAPLVVEVGAAARAAPLLGEERLERRDGVDLPAAGPAGELAASRPSWQCGCGSDGRQPASGLTASSGYS